MMPTEILVSLIAALFSIMNPIGFVGIFVAMTAHRTKAETKRIAWTCALASAITLLIVTWGGAHVMHFFGITVYSLGAAGGIILLLIALHMLTNKHHHKHSPEELDDAKSRPSVAVVPFAIPIVAGPAAMVTVLVASENYPSLMSRVEISIVVIGLAVFCGFLFSFAGPIAKWLGESGTGVVTRVMGLILAAIAMGMLTDGLKGLLPGLAG